MNMARYILVGFFFLILWPIISIGTFFLEASIIKSIPILMTGGLLDILTMSLSNTTTTIISIFIIAIFFLAIAGSFSENRRVRITSRIYCCVCLLSPSVIGTEGFGFPAPFIVSLLVGFTHLPIQRASFWFFCNSWILLFFVLLIFSPFYLLIHFEKKLLKKNEK